MIVIGIILIILVITLIFIVSLKGTPIGKFMYEWFGWCVVVGVAQLLGLDLTELINLVQDNMIATFVITVIAGIGWGILKNIVKASLEEGEKLEADKKEGIDGIRFSIQKDSL